MKRRLAAIAALTLLASCTGAKPPASDGNKPPLYLITPLPLLFGEGFALGFAKADVITTLERDFTIKSIDLPSQVPAGAALLMAQPRALPAEELVALDRWVRGGGKLVLLADPLLEWPSDRPIGDRLRPPATFADTGLLRHWGLRLDAPDTRGLVTVEDGTGDLVLQSPGKLLNVGGTCQIRSAGAVAGCAIGKGAVIVVADADFIDAPRMEALDPTVTGGPAWLSSALTSISPRLIAE